MEPIQRYDVVVLGATAGGIAAAVRAAREGSETLLVAYDRHLGGMMAGGLSYTDTLVKKARAPILESIFEGVREHYAETYGRDSRQYECSEGGYIFEPHVAEGLFEDLVDESNLTVRRGFYPVAAERDGRTVRRITFEPFDDGEPFAAAADVFVEATYEGDLAAVVGVPYRVGRESRDEFDEQFAGRLFTDIRGDRYYPREAVGNEDDSAPADRRGPLHVAPEKQQGDLDMVPHPAGLTEIFPGSTGEGDDAIQAYNYRLCLSRDPDNRRYPEKPANYDREEFLAILDDVIESGVRSYLLLRYLPNEKADMNSADLPGENHDYPEADWERREEIARRHREYALGLLYFLQNDEAVPDELRADAREWGLAEDEFVDTDNFPWQFYVREARRIEGRTTFTERDARLAPGIERAPINEDSIAIAEYPLDSHACREERRAGSQPEGFFYASQVTRPSQVPYRAMLPKGVDNLLVPVPMSTTHVAYGTIRLEPTWMHVGEAAGFAAALAAEREVAPAILDVDALQRTLVERDVLTSFFNEFDAGTDEPWVPAVEYLGAKGFFGSYDARPDAPLARPVGREWARAAAELVAGADVDPTDRARRVRASDDAADAVTAGEFRAMLARELDRASLDHASLDGVDAEDDLTRGRACQLCYRLVTDES